MLKRTVRAGYSSDNEDCARLIKYVITGVLSASAYFLLSYTAQKELAWTPFVASNVAYMITFSCSYIAQRNWTFKSDLPHKYTLSRYAALQISCSLLTGSVAHLSLQCTPDNIFIAVACATVFAGALSYMLSKTWIFSYDKN